MVGKIQPHGSAGARPAIGGLSRLTGRLAGGRRSAHTENGCARAIRERSSADWVCLFSRPTGRTPPAAVDGGGGKSSIRASFGMFYNDLEDYTNANGNGDAPYGLYWVSPTPAMFATPFVDLYTGNQEGQRFPVPAGVGNATPSNPDSNVNWAQYEPISSSPTYYYKNVTPYTESWMASVQRQLAKNAVMTVNYVGNVGRHNMVIDEANPATPSLCLALSQPSAVAPTSNVCGPFAETGLFTTASGQTVEARQQLGPSGGVNFGSTGWYRTMGSFCLQRARRQSAIHRRPHVRVGFLYLQQIPG